MDDVVLDRLVIGRDVAIVSAIEIQLADFERVLADREGNFLDHALRPDHTLRSAEAAEGGVGHGVGVERRRLRVNRRPEIGVVAVEQRAVGDRAGKIGGKAAARREHEVDAVDVALVVEADLVVDDEIVPLAGGDHVVVTVGPDLDGAAMLLRGDRRKRCELVALRFLAAEAAAHAADLDGHGIRRHAKRM